MPTINIKSIEIGERRKKENPMTTPNPKALAIAQSGVDVACVNLWLSLRTQIDITDDPSNTELEIFNLLEEHPAVRRENQERTA